MELFANNKRTITMRENETSLYPQYSHDLGVHLAICTPLGKKILKQNNMIEE
jgi:hypothetical protein